MKTLITTQVALHRCEKLPNTVDDANKFLLDLVDFIDMRVIPEELIGQKNPHCFEFVANEMNMDSIEDGITGTIVLVESHAAIHTWPNDNFVCIVVTSCKPYERSKVAQFCANYFESKHIIYY